MKLISAIIPTYNHGAFIREAVDSALAQTYKNIEVIIVDDGSTDGTNSLLACYGNRINYIYQENRGLSAARNRGIREAKGDFIAFLDADDVWFPDKLIMQLKEFSYSPYVGLVGCGGYFISENGKALEQFIKLNYKSHKNLLNDLYLKNIVSGGSEVLVKNKCFERVGMFDESLKAAEDWDMWLRILSKYEARFVEKPLVKIRVSENSMSGSSNADKMLKNELVVLDKYFSSHDTSNKSLLKAKAYSTRYLSAAIAYRENGRLSDMRACALKAGSLYPPNIFSKKFFGLIKSTIFPK